MSSPAHPSRRPGLGVLVPAIRLPGDYANVERFRRLAKDGVAGFLLFGGDEELVPPFLASLREAADRPLLVMTDAERGVGQQVQGCAELPPLMAVGATVSEERAYHHGRVTALEARALGINVVLAPVVDVLSRADNPIVGNRAFGGSADLVARLGAAWIAGAQEQGVLACAKHFPGHGDTFADSHTELPVVDAPADLLRQRELPPFRAAISAGVGSVMTAHVRYPALDPDHPATLSPRILKDLLRTELGFGGLVISDALTMEGLLLAGDGGARLSEADAAVRCLEAGCDLLLHPTDPEAVAEAIERAHDEGRIGLEALLGRTRLALSDLVTGVPDPQPLRAEHLYGAYSLARDSLTVLANEDRLLPIAANPRPRAMAILVDDDDDPARERPFRERISDFPGGFARVARSDGNQADRALLAAVEEAEVVFLAVVSSIRSAKGRARIAPDLARLVGDVLRVAPARTVTVLFTAPGAIEGLDPRPRTLVAAWGDAAVSARAAIDVILSGGPLRGLDPTVGARGGPSS